jgi:undecaprenyl pyrophosphate phosphatase UppP
VPTARLRSSQKTGDNQVNQEFLSHLFSHDPFLGLTFSFQLGIQLAALMQLLFVAVATWDAVYFHFYRFQLHLRVRSKTEHFLHTMNAILFPATVVGFFVYDVRGVLLAATVLAYLVVFGIELWDVAEEHNSRKDLGGLPPTESVLHFAMGLLRAAVLGLVVALKLAFPTPQELPHWVVVMGATMALAGIPMAAVHVFPGLFPKFLLKEVLSPRGAR